MAFLRLQNKEKPFFRSNNTRSFASHFLSVPLWPFAIEIRPFTNGEKNNDELINTIREGIDDRDSRSK